MLVSYRREIRFEQFLRYNNFFNAPKKNLENKCVIDLYCKKETRAKMSTRGRIKACFPGTDRQIEKLLDSSRYPVNI